SDAATVIRQDATIKLGNGFNGANLKGTWDGQHLTYRGGSGLDHVIAEMNAPNAAVNIKTYDSTDDLQLPPGFTNVHSLFPDLGNGTDSYEDGGYVLPAGSQVIGVP